MGLFNKKPKTPIDLLEDQLKYWRGKVNNFETRFDAVKRITEIEHHLMILNQVYIPERIKALEEAIAELYLTGREDK